LVTNIGVALRAFNAAIRKIYFKKFFGKTQPSQSDPSSFAVFFSKLKI
jgi:hypothetical protein